jgi:hypothetical protein
MLCSPGIESDASCFHENGEPIQFKIKFVAGKANVPANLADYLIDKEAVDIEPPKEHKIIRTRMELLRADHRPRTHRILGAKN